MNKLLLAGVAALSMLTASAAFANEPSVFRTIWACNGINVEMLVTDRCADEDAVHYDGFPALKLSLEPSGITQ
jgi:hypothetical protein